MTRGKNIGKKRRKYKQLKKKMRLFKRKGVAALITSA
jgi:hypothetical protein